MQVKTKSKEITNCAIYTRVSTDMQAEKEINSCETQAEKIKLFIESQEGYKIFKIYDDPGYTGANIDRPALKQLFTDIQSGLINVVLTYKIDRLTRSPKDFYQIIEIFEQFNVSYISVTERFDTSTPSGRLLRNIMLTFAQFERELISERIKDKYHQRILRGLPNGGNPYGYKWDNKKYFIDQHKSKTVKFVFDTYIQTKSLAETTRKLKENKIFGRDGRIYGRSFVWKMLRNPNYTGKIEYHEKLYKGQHEPIISEDMFNYVQTLHKEYHNKKPLDRQLLFAGLIQCQECGTIMSATYTNKKTQMYGLQKYYYYRCNRCTHHGWDACTIKHVSADRFNTMLIYNLKRISKDFDFLKNLIFVL
ncbi:MAG: hypothetical protein GF384_08030, partial [Elusimicrobia bacterium]|nr:hypothetical protein [Elusimicrobiota bacterium]